MHQCKGPKQWRCTCAIEQGVCYTFYVLILSFCCILVLLVWFTLPVIDDVVLKDVLHILDNFNLSPITDQLGHGTSSLDVILENMDKLLISLHGINITHHGLGTNKELCCSDSTVNCWCV